MHDIIDVIKNLETLTSNDSAFKVLKDFERVIDELDVYVFKNWEDGELVTGPDVDRYTVTCKFMWPYENMPDPEGGARLTDYGCKIGSSAFFGAGRFGLNKIWPLLSVEIFIPSGSFS